MRILYAGSLFIVPVCVIGAALFFEGETSHGKYNFAYGRCIFPTFRSPHTGPAAGANP